MFPPNSPEAQYSFASQGIHSRLFKNVTVCPSFHDMVGGFPKICVGIVFDVDGVEFLLYAFDVSAFSMGVIELYSIRCHISVASGH